MRRGWKLHNYRSFLTADLFRGLVLNDLFAVGPVHLDHFAPSSAIQAGMKSNRNNVTSLEGLSGPAVSHHDVRRMGFDCPMPRFAGFISAVETNFAVWIGPNKIGDGGLHRRRFAHIVEGRATMMSEHGNGEKQKETGVQPQGGKQLSVHVDSSSGRNLVFRVYSLI